MKNVFARAGIALALTFGIATFVHSAQAMSLDTYSGNNPDGSARFTDPDRKVESFGQNNGGLRFGAQPGSNQPGYSLGIFGSGNPDARRTPSIFDDSRRNIGPGTR